jgi:hypothetical protein
MLCTAAAATLKYCCSAVGDVLQSDAPDFVATVPALELPSPFDSLPVTAALTAHWTVLYSSGEGMKECFSVSMSTDQQICRPYASMCLLHGAQLSYE